MIQPTLENRDIGSRHFFSLRDHRIQDVRGAARAALLAYGFLRGKQYKSIENKTKPMNQIDRTRLIKETKRLVNKFGGENRDEEVIKWLDF